METAAAPALTLSAYGERVFRLQNTVMDQLMDAESAMPSPAESAYLAQAESHIIESCKALNEAAGLQMERHKPGWLLRARIAGSLAACDAAVHAVETQSSTRILMSGVGTP